MPEKNVRVRFAPSPTGYLHIGGLRTALYNYLFAKAHDGTFLLRIEDTDRRRFVEGSLEDIIDMLRWAGIQYDEGPGKEGSFGPYFQSERLKIYKEHADRLVSEGKAYYAFDTPDQLEEMRKEESKKGNPAPKYDIQTRMNMTNGLTRSDDEVRARIESGEAYVIRLLVPENKTVSWSDAVRGEVAFESRDIDDKVLFKADGYPTYHLANVVDDHLMEITHVLRGEEWISSVPHHVLLYESFGWEPPKFAHLPLLLNPQKKKLSKRDGDVEVRQFKAAGYLPEALMNFVAFLGWNPGDDREIYDLESLAKDFSVSRIGKSGAIFNVEKLDWFNAHYLRAKTDEEICDLLEPEFKGSEFEHPGRDVLLQIIRMMRERVSFVREFITNCPYFYKPPDEYDAKAVRKRWTPDAREHLELLAGKFRALETLDTGSAESVLRELAEKLSVKAGDLIHPLRLAVTGVPHGAGVFETLALIGKDEVVRRLETALKRFDKVVQASQN